MALQPSIFFRLVSVQVVEHNVDFAAGIGGDDFVHEVEELYVPRDHGRPKVCGGRHGAFFNSDELAGESIRRSRSEKLWIRVEDRGLAEADGRKTRCAQVIVLATNCRSTYGSIPPFR